MLLISIAKSDKSIVGDGGKKTIILTEETIHCHLKYEYCLAVNQIVMTTVEYLFATITST